MMTVAIKLFYVFNKKHTYKLIEKTYIIEHAVMAKDVKIKLWDRFIQVKDYYWDQEDKCYIVPVGICDTVTAEKLLSEGFRYNDGTDLHLIGDLKLINKKT